MALQSTTAIATINLQQASSTVTFSGIPNTYKDLILTISCPASTFSGINGTFNSDSSSSYSNVWMQATGGVQSGSGTTTSAESLGFLDATPTSAVVQLLDYSATDKHKSFLCRMGGVSYSVTRATAGRWAKTEAINSIQLSASSFPVGSTISLYGRIA